LKVGSFHQHVTGHVSNSEQVVQVLTA